jgi:hypothetical protein
MKKLNTKNDFYNNIIQPLVFTCSRKSLNNKYKPYCSNGQTKKSTICKKKYKYLF